MRTLHIDAERHQWISTGNVEPVAKWVDIAGNRTRTDEQDTGPTGLPLWTVEAIVPGDPSDARAATEIVRVTVQAPALPEVGGFGTPLAFEGMTCDMWSSKDRRDVSQRFSATGVRLAGQATGRTARTEAA